MAELPHPPAPDRAVVHALGNCLNQIMGYARMVIEEAEPLDRPQMLSDLKKILHAAQKMQSILESLQTKNVVRPE
jgi:light-regulated signal transduction histidine kinase (bacteriophytochrome)